MKLTEIFLVCRRLHSSEGEAIGHKGVVGDGSPEVFFTPLTCSLSTEGSEGAQAPEGPVLKRAWAFKQQSMHPRKAGNFNRC